MSLCLVPGISQRCVGPFSIWNMAGGKRVPTRQLSHPTPQPPGSWPWPRKMYLKCSFNSGWVVWGGGGGSCQLCLHSVARGPWFFPLITLWLFFHLYIFSKGKVKGRGIKGRMAGVGWSHSSRSCGLGKVVRLMLENWFIVSFTLMIFKYIILLSLYFYS